MKIIQSYWFSSMTIKLPVGIVIMKNSIGEVKAYIGIGTGDNQEYDENHIAEWGTPFPVKQLEEMAKHFKDEKFEGRDFNKRNKFKKKKFQHNKYTKIIMEE